MLKMLASFLVIVSLCSFGFKLNVYAQTDQQKVDKRAEKVHKKILKIGTGEKAKIEVQLFDDTKYKGYINEANDNSFTVTDKQGASNSVKYSDVKSAVGQNVLTGGKIAFVVVIGALAAGAIAFLAYYFTLKKNG